MEARVADLPSYRVVKLRYHGPPPPDQRFLEHWQRFSILVERLSVESTVADVQAIGYAPPTLTSGDVLVYDACRPVPAGFAPTSGGLDGLELDDLPGGRYVLCAGPIIDLPDLLQAAKRYAMSHGLAIERGRIEIFRPLPPGSDMTPVDVGYRVHD